MRIEISYTTQYQFKDENMKYSVELRCYKYWYEPGNLLHYIPDGVFMLNSLNEVSILSYDE